jgi:hypothetical protein
MCVVVYVWVGAAVWCVRLYEVSLCLCVCAFEQSGFILKNHRTITLGRMAAVTKIFIPTDIVSNSACVFYIVGRISSAHSVA